MNEFNLSNDELDFLDEELLICNDCLERKHKQQFEQPKDEQRAGKEKKD